MSVFFYVFCRYRRSIRVSGSRFRVEKTSNASHQVDAGCMAGSYVFRGSAPPRNDIGGVASLFQWVSSGGDRGSLLKTVPPNVHSLNCEP